jgi:hypothetical protein
MNCTNTEKNYAEVKGVRIMVFSATFNNISVISWRSDLLVEETGVPGRLEKTTDLPQVTEKLIVYRVHLV